MHQATTPKLSRIPSWALPAAVVLVVMGSLGAVILLAQRASGSDAPPQPAPYVAPGPLDPFERFSVQAAAAGKVLIVRDAPKGAPAVAPLELTFPADTKVERLIPIALSAIKVGDNVSVSGVPNPVRNFAIRRVVVMANASPAGADGFARSPAGFIGDETSADPLERTIVGGIVETITGKTLSLRGPNGVVQLTIEAAAPLFRLEPVTAAAIREGDRLASRSFPPGGVPSAVLTEPARP